MARSKVGQLGRDDEYAYRYDRRYARRDHISEQSVNRVQSAYVCILTNMRDRFGQGRARVALANRSGDFILGPRREEINIVVTVRQGNLPFSSRTPAIMQARAYFDSKSPITRVREGETGDFPRTRKRSRASRTGIGRLVIRETCPMYRRWIMEPRS